MRKKNVIKIKEISVYRAKMNQNRKEKLQQNKRNAKKK